MDKIIPLELTSKQHFKSSARGADHKSSKEWYDMHDPVKFEIEPVKQHEKMSLKGEHLIMTLRVKDNLENTQFLKDMLFNAIHKSKATIINFVEHKFQPQGYSLVILIGESHASIHTYPEEQGLFIDYFTCGDIKTNIFKEYILNKLKVKQVIEMATIERGENG